MTHGWRSDLAIYVAVGAAITLIFVDGTLDLASARLFYRADPTEAWPYGKQLPWSLLYGMAPWITATLVLDVPTERGSLRIVDQDGVKTSSPRRRDPIYEIGSRRRSALLIN